MSKPRRTKGGRWTLGFALAYAVAVTAQATPEPDFPHARVSYDSGNGMVKGQDDADWSYVSINTLVLPGDNLWIDQEGTLELELLGGTFFRMADGSKAEVVSVPPAGRFRTWTGAFSIQRSPYSEGEMVMETPVCQVKTDADSQVRLDVIGNGATTVTVRWGRALVWVEGADPVQLNAGERSFIDPGYLPSLPAQFDRREEDAFDTWNRERSRLVAAGLDAVPRAVRIDRAPIGVADLHRYGEWVRVEDEYCWRPTAVVDFVPYRRGHWSFVPGCGHVWVDDDPFCYVTSHYGRWRHTDRYGWVWTYREGWSPAWVASVHYGSNLVWCPLDPHDRPVSFGAEFFTVGGLRFGLSISTFCGADELRAGPCPVRPCTPVIVRNVPPTQINIWNISIGNRSGGNAHGHRAHGLIPYADRLQVRDLAPQRVIRGWETTKLGGEPARMRVTNLEGREGRSQFTPIKHGGGNLQARTAVEPGRLAAQPRKTRVNAAAIEEVRKPGAAGLSSHPAGAGHGPGRNRDANGVGNASENAGARGFPGSGKRGDGKPERFPIGGATSPDAETGVTGAGKSKHGKGKGEGDGEVGKAEGKGSKAGGKGKAAERGPGDSNPGAMVPGSAQPVSPGRETPTDKKIRDGVAGPDAPGNSAKKPGTGSVESRPAPWARKPGGTAGERATGHGGSDHKPATSIPNLPGTAEPRKSPRDALPDSQPSKAKRPPESVPDLRSPGSGKGKPGGQTFSPDPQWRGNRPISPAPAVPAQPAIQPKPIPQRDAVPDMRVPKGGERTERSGGPSFKQPGPFSSPVGGGGAPQIRRVEPPSAPPPASGPAQFQGPRKPESRGPGGGGGGPRKGKDREDKE